MVLLSISFQLQLLLEQAARDNGFELEVPSVSSDSLSFRSSRVPLRIWLGGGPGDLDFVGLSQSAVARALGGTPAAAGPGRAYEVKAAAPLPPGASAARSVNGVPELHPLLRRAFQLSATLPDELLHTFEKAVEGLPRATEAERLVVERVGQGVFRQGLLDYWQGRCALTGLDVPELLRASHIKPWADCETDAERLDVHNGLLLAAHADAAFDQGFITFGESGELLISPQLPASALSLLNLHGDLEPLDLAPEHHGFPPWHRQHVFRG